MSSTDDSTVRLQEAVAAAFGRGEPAESVDMFRRAGFCDEDARRGARMLESGRYFGFEDAATSMGLLNEAEFRRRNPNVTSQRIAEVVASLSSGGSKPVDS